ncbi:hypothetical protein BVC80_9035g33 [Macleaya cordata]|uniref:Bifunctional inhibitor/plant lipid transfer protein/seed storage helical domain-containing protein n=1 Tax=Macleaya cordata TaxID=56857 RepID=A0A200QYF0_MACCD|nr:hypothetical protein BVC80_9035g33 [Macleaya cordata]
MALKGIKMGLIAAFVTLLWAGVVTAQSQSGCTSVIISMSPCLDYITGNSSTPSSSCCSQLSSDRNHSVSVKSLTVMARQWDST